jgi:hypothetical protein
MGNDTSVGLAARSMLVALTALSALLAPSAPAQSIDLKGRVVDPATRSGIPGADVRVAGTDLITRTDSAGRFRLTGAVPVREGSPRAVASPYFRGPDLFVEASEPGGEARVEFYGLGGESLASARRSLVAGWNRIEALPPSSGDFAGFARISSGGNTWLRRVVHVAGPARALVSADYAPAAGPSAKAAATGNIEVTVERLLPRSVAYASATADMGDIVMAYPERRLGVGVPPIFGAKVLFDGGRGRAAAMAELQAKWRDWPRFTPSAIMFRIARDPQYPADTNRVTLQSCCDTLWGYDDIQAKEAHGDVQLHVEWIGMGRYDEDENPDAGDGSAGVSSPSYVNSGVYVQSRYELQIESQGKSDDRHTMASLVDDHAASTLAPDSGNGKWQCYDITFRSARYNSAGQRTENARVSVWWNGVLVHDNRDARAPATGLSNHSGEELNATLYGLKLQSEGRDVRFRNIWMKHLVIDQPQTRFGY